MAGAGTEGSPAEKAACGRAGAASGYSVGMRAVVQRVSEASVTIAGRSNGRIGRGLLVLVGVEQGDGRSDAEWLSAKIVALRSWLADEVSAFLGSARQAP